MENKAWLSAKDIQQLVPVSTGTARDIIKTIRAQMSKEGAYLIKSKQLLAPAKRVKELLEL